MVDNRSLQESGIRYFTEENEAGKNSVINKIKEIANNAWEGIVRIFEKIKDFFDNLIKNFKVKSSNPKNIDAVKNFPDLALKDIIKEKVSYVYINLEDMDKFIQDKLDMDHWDLETDASFGSSHDVEEVYTNHYMADNIKYIENFITKDYLINSAFGGFRKQLADTDSKFKLLKSAYRKTIDEYSGFDEFRSEYITHVKRRIKTMNAISKIYSKMIFHNSKVVVTIVNEIIKRSK